ncbi:hypothetical protein ACN2WE_31180 [Streptomyces sp. cg28]|uniref:hypothetical protein n=1 Tax=Streptomyces sp. cg28 TaxID=3403457 RepID=UPI003B212832
MADSHDFPDDLLAAQKRTAALWLELHRFTAQPTLPWSVEPLDGWEAPEVPHGGKVAGYASTRPDSPGWSEGDKATYEQLWRDLTDATFTVLAHRHWTSYSGADVVKARMALKHHPASQPGSPAEPTANESLDQGDLAPAV